MIHGHNYEIALELKAITEACQYRNEKEAEASTEVELGIRCTR